MVKSGDKDDLYIIRKPGLKIRGQFHAVAPGHGDIKECHLRLHLPDGFQGVIGVIERAHQFKVFIIFQQIT